MPSPLENDASACVEEQHSISVSGWRAHDSWASVVSMVCSTLGPSARERSNRITASVFKRSGSVDGT